MYIIIYVFAIILLSFMATVTLWLRVLKNLSINYEELMRVPHYIHLFYSTFIVCIMCIIYSTLVHC